jgi:hypothetical protein
VALTVAYKIGAVNNALRCTGNDVPHARLIAHNEGNSVLIQTRFVLLETSCCFLMKGLGVFVLRVLLKSQVS